MTRASGLRVGIVGATGMVGRELIHALETRKFPVADIKPFSSGRSQKFIHFRGRPISAPEVDSRQLASCQLVVFVSSDEISKKLAPGLAQRGVWVIDDSSAFRLHPDVPLVIPEVNAAALGRDKRLIAGPNCTMTGLAVAGHPLHKIGRAFEARVASYQAVSGAGKAALEEFFSQARGLNKKLKIKNGRAPLLPIAKSSALPRAIAFNVIPQVGGFGADGYASEESKVAAELRKIWGAPNLAVSVTAVRVPVVRGHCLAAWLRFKRALSPGYARRLLAKAPGLKLCRDNDYPTPLSCSGLDPVFSGRVRRGASQDELCLWIVSDNLLKGAALNSVQIAEELVRRGWLKA